MAGHEADIHNFSPTQHRLPTITGVEALQDAAARSKGISTNLPTLDARLLSHSLVFGTPGIQRGHVTEVFGPPGIGKTTFGIQVAVNAAQSQQNDCHVLWVNTGSPLISRRVQEMCSSDLPTVPALLNERFSYLDAHTLPRLLTVFLHPTTSTPSTRTSLIVVDDLSNLLLGALARTSTSSNSSAPAIVREKLDKQATSKRFQVIESLAAAMSKMAAIRNIAIVVLTNATMSLKDSNRALLKPGLSSQAWESAVHTRIMLYRDFADTTQRTKMPSFATGLRYAEVQRLARKDVYIRPVPFVILSTGLHELNHEATHDLESSPIQTAPPDQLPLLPVELSPPAKREPSVQAKKRKAVEIADSEDDESSEEPTLPQVDFGRHGQADEMLLETHETALLRRERQSLIRGSEDELPSHSSDIEDEN
jgi:RecA/RadA recombinase